MKRSNDYNSSDSRQTHEMSGMARNVVCYLCCLPFQGVLPPLPIFALLFVFHVNLWRYFASSVSGNLLNLFAVLIPLYVILVIVIVIFFICTRQGLLSIFVVLGLAVMSVLIPAHVELLIETTWPVVMTPLFIVLGLLLLQLIYLSVNDCMHVCCDGGRVWMQGYVQRGCVAAYLVGIALLLAGAITIIPELASGPITNAMQLAVPIFVGVSLLSTGILVNTVVRAAELIHTRDSHMTPGSSSEAVSFHFSLSQPPLSHIRFPYGISTCSQSSHVFPTFFFGLGLTFAILKLKCIVVPRDGRVDCGRPRYSFSAAGRQLV